MLLKTQYECRGKFDRIDHLYIIFGIQYSMFNNNKNRYWYNVLQNIILNIEHGTICALCKTGYSRGGGGGNYDYVNLDSKSFSTTM